MAQPFVEPCSRGIITAEPGPRELGREIAPRTRPLVLAACVVASAMAFIDGSALTVALPSLRADLDADLASVQWVLNGYVLALASLTLIGGALADAYGKARMLSIGCIAGLSIMFFLLPFDLVDRRALPSTDAGLAFLPFTLGIGLLSRIFGGLADKMGARAMLIMGSAGAAMAYIWMALGQEASLPFGVIGPMALLGISFAALVAPLTASVMSSVDQADEGLASGINNAASRIAQLTGIALSAGVASFASGYEIGLAAAAAVSLAAAVAFAATVPPAAGVKHADLRKA